MGQERLNHLMVLHVHKAKTDNLDLTVNTDLSYYYSFCGKFCESDLV